tara:strand:- start:505 stop:978 length:474 start_codon:yes stop_codon:yes gene_type:complete
MQGLLDRVKPQLQKARICRDTRPTLTEARINRRNLLHRVEKNEPLWRLRKSAFDAIDALLEAGWPPMSSTQRSQKHDSGEKYDPGDRALELKRKRGHLKDWQPPVPPPLPMLPQLAGPSHIADDVDHDHSGSDVWCCDVKHAGCIKPLCVSPEPAHT